MALFTGTPAEHAKALSNYLSAAPPSSTLLPPTLLNHRHPPGAIAAAALATLPPADALTVCGAVLARTHPGKALAGLRERVGDAAAASGVCGTVWRRDELAYKCKDCERDPTCAICVACFRAGDHKGHEFAMIRTAGGCCDCGDVQAWKSGGFCWRHRGASAEEDDPAQWMDESLKVSVVDVAAAVADVVRREVQGVMVLMEEDRDAALKEHKRDKARARRDASRDAGIEAVEVNATGAGGLAVAIGGGAAVVAINGPGHGVIGEPVRGAGGAVGRRQMLQAQARVQTRARHQARQHALGTGHRWETGTGNVAGADGVAQEARAGAASVVIGQASAQQQRTEATAKRRRNIRQCIAKICAAVKWLGALVECGDGIRRVVAVQLSKVPCPPHCRTSVDATDGGSGSVSDADTDAASVIWLENMLSVDGCDQLPSRVHRDLHALYYQLITDLVFKRCFLELFSANYERFVTTLVRKKSLLRPSAGYVPPDLDDDEDSTAGHYLDDYGRSESKMPSDVMDSFSVQLFTVPALIPVMIRDGGVLDVLLRVILNIFEAASSPADVYSNRGKKASAQDESEARDNVASPSPVAGADSDRVGAVASSAPNSLAEPDQAISRLPEDVRDNLESFGIFHPINGLTFDAVFDENQNRPRRTRESPVGTADIPLGSGTVSAAAVEVFPVGDEEVEHASGDVEDEGDGGDGGNAMSVSSSGENGSDSGAGGEGDRTVAVDGGAAVGEAVNRNGGIEDDEVAMNIEIAGDDQVGAEDVAVEVELTADEDGGNEDDGNGSDSDEHNFAVEIEGEVVDVQVVMEDDTVDPVEEETMRHFGAARLRQRGRNRKNLAADREDARKRFLAIIEARKKTAAAVSGEGSILHPMRVDWSPKQSIFDTVGWRVIRDLRYVLTHVEVAVHLIHSRPDLLRLFLRIVSTLQGMNPTPRQFGEHVRKDSEIWGKAFTLEIEFFHLVELLVVAFCHDPPRDSTTNSDVSLSPSQSRLRATKLVRGCLDEWLDREEVLEAGSVPDGETFTIATSISMHVPLHRLLAVFGHHLIRLDCVDIATSLSGEDGRNPGGPDSFSFSEEDVKARDTRNAERVLKHLLRIQVFLGQVQAGMWRRNGRAAMGHLMLYRNVVCAEWSVDLDLFLMQQTCVVMGAEVFQNRVGEEFALGEMVSNFMRLNLPVGLAGGTWDQDDTDLPPSAIASQVDEYEPALLESMVTLLVHVSTDRARCGYSNREYLRRKFLHLLCIADQTHSQLLRACPHWILQSQAPQDNFALSSSARAAESGSVVGDVDAASSTSTAVKETLDAIAVFSHPRGMEQGHYCLKDDLWVEFDHFLPHLSAREREAAAQRFSAVRSRLNLPPQIIPVLSVVDRPTYVSFNPLLDELYQMASHKNSLIAVVFRRFLQPSGLRALEGVLPPALQIAVAAIEAVPKCPTHEGNTVGRCNARWLNNLAAGDAFHGSILDSASKMYERSRSDSSSLFYEARLALTRILEGAYARGDTNLKKRLHFASPQLVPSPAEDEESSATQPARASGGRASSLGGEGGIAQEDEAPAEDSRRERMLRMKKARQAAAMERMRAAQAKFACTIGEDEGTEDRGAVAANAEAGEISGSGQPGLSTSAVEGEADSERASTAPASLVRDHVCALCRESELAPDVMGLIGFAQKTKVPHLANQSRGKLGIQKPMNTAGSSSEVANAENGNVRRSVFINGMIVDDFFYQSGEDGESYITSAVDGYDDGGGGEAGSDSGVDATLADHGLAGSGQVVQNHSGTAWAYDRSVGLSRGILVGGIEAGPTVHIGFCGHAIHIECYERYFESLKVREQNRDMFEGHQLLTLAAGEFLCPVCRRMANFMLPLMTADDKEMMAANGGGQGDSDMATWAHRAFRRLALTTQPSLSGSSNDVTRQPSLSRGGNAAGDDLMAPWVNRPESLDRKSSVATWSSAMTVLSRLGEVVRDVGNESPSGGRLSSSIVEQSLPGHYQLCCAAGATIVCAEIAARSGAWEEAKARRVIGTLVRQTRVRVKDVISSQHNSPVTHELWKCLMSGSEPAVDAFTVVLFILFQWPTRLTEQDVRHLVCAGYVATVDVARRGDSDLILGSLLYLRRAAVLIGCIYDREINLRSYPSEVSSVEKSDLESEHGELTHFLGLTRPEDVSVAWLVEDSPPASMNETKNRVGRRVNFVPRRVGLLKLPDVFQDLLEKVDGRQCHSCRQAPQKPALCLTCGQVVCSIKSVQSSAPQVSKDCPGWTKEHAQSCGGGVGIFLILKTTNVHVFRNNRLARWGSPYLDEHGEEDPELRRGKPLLLSVGRYAVLENLWLSHGFDHDSRVLNHSYLSREWNTLFLATGGDALMV